MKKRVLLKGLVILAAVSTLFFAGCKTEGEEGGLPHEAPQWLIGHWEGVSQMTTKVVFDINANLGFSCVLDFANDALGAGTGISQATVTGMLSPAGLYLYEYMLIGMQADDNAPSKVKSGLAGFNGMKAKLIPNATLNSFTFVAFSVPGGLTTLANQFFGGIYTKK